MNIEKIQLQFKPGSFQQVNNQIIFTDTQSKSTVSFRAPLKPYLDLFSQGLSLQQVLTRMLAEGQNPNPIHAYQCLKRICMKKCITNDDQFSSFFQEETKSEIEFDHSLMLQPFSEVLICKESIKWSGQIILASLFSLVGLVSLLRVPNIQSALDFESFSAHDILSILLIPSLTTSLIAVGHLFSQFIFSGQLPTTRLCLSPIGISVQAENRVAENFFEALLQFLTGLLGCMALNLALAIGSDSSATLARLVFFLTFALVVGSHRSGWLTGFISTLSGPKKKLAPLRLFVGATVIITYLSFLVFLFKSEVEFIQAFLQQTKPQSLVLSALLAAIAIWTVLACLDLVTQIISALKLFAALIDDDYLNKSSAVVNSENFDLRKFLMQLPLFAKLDTDTINKLAAESKIYKVGPKTKLCRQGEQSTDLYVFIKGQAEVFKYIGPNRQKKILTLESRSVFGEGGFFFRQPRSATVITTTESLVLRISNSGSFQISRSAEFEENFKRYVWSYQALASSPMFSELPRESLQFFLNHGKVIEVQRGQMIFNQGSTGQDLYLIIQGGVDAVQDGITVNSMKALEIFGEIALLKAIPRTTTCVANQKTLLYMIDRDSFWEILSQNIELAMHVESLALSRWQNSTNH